MAPAFLMRKTGLVIIGSLALAGAAGMAYAFNSSAGSLASSQGEVSGMQDVSNQSQTEVQSQSGASTLGQPSDGLQAESGQAGNNVKTEVTVNGQPIDVPEQGSTSQTISSDGQTTHVNVSSNTSSSASGGSQRVSSHTNVSSRTHSNTRLDASP